MMLTSEVSVPQRPKDLRRAAVGYVRVSTSMQAEDGLSRDAQRAAITAYYSAHELRPLRICTDGKSGTKSDRLGAGSWRRARRQQKNQRRAAYGRGRRICVTAE
mgnify:CR=1 FL=1